VGSATDANVPVPPTAITSKANLPNDPQPMILSNAKGDIVTIWLEKLPSGVQGLKAATGKQSFETSKMLIYWGGR